MKKHLLTIGAAALAIFATQQAAQASLSLVSSGTGTLVATGGTPLTMSVGYNVVYDDSLLLYTYVYTFTPAANAAIGELTINASYVNSVLTSGTGLGSPYTITGPVTSTGSSFGDYVDWEWKDHTLATQVVGFTSLFGPTAGSSTLQDTLNGPWSDNNGIGTPVPVPVPEASTVMAGALMLLPFGIGAIRSLRKERVA